MMNFFSHGRVTHHHRVVRCKRCCRDVPSGCAAHPEAAVVVRCPLCGEVRRYRPTEVYLGTPDTILSRQPAQREARPKHLQYRHKG